MRLVKRFLLLASLCLPLSVFAADYKIAVVDIEAAISSSKQFQQWKSQLEGKYSKERDQLQSLATEGNQLKEKLQKEGDFLGEEQKKALVVQVQQKFQAFQQLKGALGQEMKNQEQQFLQQLRPKVEGIIKEMVDEQDIDLLLHRRALVYANPDVDLTMDVIAEINK